ncbi:MAG: hypothetical protein HC839_05550, partial [Leptolyngbyaceae cyanobacterium RM2_2_21]|nr:hypothetical protein [Leptolyngbyaceae cyanobacterium RM2_2_21]
MRTFYSSTWLYLSDRPYANYLILLFWLSLGLTLGLGACKPAGAEILEAGSGFSETVPASADEDEDDFIAEQAFATAPELAAATKLPPKAGLAASE